MVCNEIALAWSGSNIGYHANVYIEGLQPKPADVQFSAEWGLKDRYTSRPHRAWGMHDPEAVTDEIMRRAGNPDILGLEQMLDTARGTFGRLKEDALSILTIACGDRKDTFLDGKLGELERLNAPTLSSIRRGLLPSGQIWSRDTLALTQGLTLAPHQMVSSLRLYAVTLERAIDRLEQDTRASASHLRRLERRGKRASLVGTNVFIGHGRSAIWRELKDFVEDRLGLPVDEFNSVPVAGISTTARLAEMLDAAAIAFLIMTAEDEHADDRLYARQNVVHEVGLFQGRLGFTRAIVLLEEGCEDFSNIHGLGQVRFPGGNIAAAFENVRAILEREGLVTPSGP
jgi:hypothetical protein